ncbi:NXPE family member 3-like isoform X1 [Epinephelus moara]|uniref:NXPE family member 3-like isoform X1 n=1 Tax=Epinephelus moara TaxID=300413 RepID=UPI00214F56ED|nr:NXPE family member 3-like isoform X1 [Epinephelus moara]XP_049891946.1 NXPE family member 3-like isoform X1 [Epinephelus moara]
MKARACTRREYSAIFLVLAVAVLILVLCNMAVLEFHHKVNSTIIVPKVSTDPDMNQSFCTFQPLSPEDALEERLLLDSIAWPETPPLPAPVSLEQTSDPAHSTFTVLPRRGGGQWHVGDQLEVMIKMSDFHGHPKKHGGDFLLARLHNLKLGAGVAGQVLDHLNGSYSAVFSLPWEGDAQVEVMLVHPSDAILVLNRLNREHPDRILFKSLFRSGSLSETTDCNVCLRPTQQLLCNYTDVRTGQPWFCYKPKNLSCDARISHARGQNGRFIKANEEKLFRSGVNLKVYIRASGPARFTVLPKKKGQLEVKSSSVTSGPSGYYYQGAWRALDGTTVQQFNTSSAITECLKGKKVHLYGDSTVRQWFEFLNKNLPDLKEFHPQGRTKFGPFMAIDNANSIMVTFNFHGPPLVSFIRVPPTTFYYIANEIDRLTGGTDTIVGVGIWAHFPSFPIELYIRRLQSIRRAVVRLLTRAPGTVVIIRTGHPRALTFDLSLIFSDWYSLQRYKVLRAMFKGMNVHLIDAWSMVLAHHLPHNIHPLPPIIKNMINILLSHVCPQNST